MTRRELFKRLNCLCLELADYYDINNGGCCYVAAVIAEQLEKHNISFKIAVAYSPTHYWIRVSDRYINRDGFKAEFIENWDSDCLYNIYDEGGWNDSYNRKYNLIVQTKIKSLFKKYENNRNRFYTRTSWD